MSLLLALFLGLIQGLTEFFPVSSSAHLKLTKMLFSIDETPVIFDLAVHLGTLVAMLWFFKREIMRLFQKDRGKLLYLVIALIPLLPSYYFLKPIREFVANPQFLGFFMMATGGILLAGQRLRLKKKGRLFRDVLLIGTMQSAALVPGISRSASTISIAQILGWRAKDAVRFSFLLAIPTIMGGNILEAMNLWKSNQLDQLFNLYCLVGFAAALCVGLFLIRFAVSFLEKGNIKGFGWYCLVIGMVVNVYMYLR